MPDAPPPRQPRSGSREDPAGPGLKALENAREREARRLYNPPMQLLPFLWDLVVHLDVHLGELVRRHGVWVYGLLLVIVFCETGLVLTPFLPGDSLLFVAGTLAAAGGMNIWLGIARPAPPAPPSAT